MRDSRVVGHQRGHSWSGDATPGIVSVSGRLVHRREECPGYRQGIDEAAREGRNVAVVERGRHLLVAREVFTLVNTGAASV